MAPRQLVYPCDVASQSLVEQAFRSQLQAEPTFSLFPRLPDELKLRIFELAIRPRALVMPSRFKDSSFYLPYQLRDIHRSMNSILSLLTVSSIARQAVHPFYRMMFSLEQEEADSTDSDYPPDNESPAGADGPDESDEQASAADGGKCSSAVLVNIDQDIIFLEPCLTQCRAVFCCRRMFSTPDRLAVTRLGVQMETIHRLETNDRIWGRLCLSWPNVRTLYMVKVWEERRYFPGMPWISRTSSELFVPDDSDHDDDVDMDTANNSDSPALDAHDGSAGAVSSVEAAEANNSPISQVPWSMSPSGKFPMLKLDPKIDDLLDVRLANYTDINATEYREDVWDCGYQEWAVARAASDPSIERVKAAFESWKVSKKENSVVSTPPPALEEVVFVVMLRSRRPVPGQPLGSQYDKVLEHCRETGRASDIIIG